MHTSTHTYKDRDEELHGFLAYDDSITSPRPAVIVVHDWSGRNEFACEKVKAFAEMGYLGFALDMYGQARQGTTNDEKMALMNPLVSDRKKLQQRILAAFNTVSAMPEVDSKRIACIGFCFGGLCALDLARCGADVQGVVSFHGLLGKPEHAAAENITAKVLVLHGYEDPMVKPEQVEAFCQEMTSANVDWQVQMYGHVKHAFTNPQAHDVDLGLMFDTKAAERSWLAMRNFLHEIFAISCE